MGKFIAGAIVLCLGITSSVFAEEMPEKKAYQPEFRVGVTNIPMYTLTSALAYGSPVEALLVEKDDKGNWQIPDNLTVLFWSGAELEPELGKVLAQSNQAAVSMIEAAGVHQLAKRTPTGWEKPGEDEDPHNESTGKDYGMIQTIRPEGDIDKYYWLDPLNAMAALEGVKMVFQGLDQRNHWAYQANADQIIAALWELDIQLNKLLHDVIDQPLMVLQDEFQYLEMRYKLTTVPAGGSARNIADKANARKSKCVVTTRPIDQHLKTVLDKASLNSVELDPAGQKMPKTTGAYFKWFGKLASRLNNCVTK